MIRLSRRTSCERSSRPRINQYSLNMFLFVDPLALHLLPLNKISFKWLNMKILNREASCRQRSSPFSEEWLQCTCPHARQMPKLQPSCLKTSNSCALRIQGPALEPRIWELPSYLEEAGMHAVHRAGWKKHSNICQHLRELLEHMGVTAGRRALERHWADLHKG